MCIVDSVCVDPSGSVMVAEVPGGKTTVACRDPMSSMETEPRATWVVAAPPAISETDWSGGTITTSGIGVKSCQEGVTWRWTAIKSARS